MLAMLDYHAKLLCFHLEPTFNSFYDITAVTTIADTTMALSFYRIIQPHGPWLWRGYVNCRDVTRDIVPIRFAPRCLFTIPHWRANFSCSIHGVGGAFDLMGGIACMR